MADAGSGPSETPRGDKRVVRGYETPITVPAAKAQRTEAAVSGGGGGGGGSSISALLAQLKTTVAALEAADPSSFSCTQAEEVSSAGLALFSFSRDLQELQAAREAERCQQVVDETPLPFDMLVHALAYLPTKDLAAAAQVSRHFSRAIPEVVKQRLERILSRFTLERGETYCTDLLQRVEADFKLAKEGIPSIESTMSDKDFNKVAGQLRGMGKQVIMAVHEDLRPKVDAMQGVRRSALLQVLNQTGLPQDELVKHLETVVSILSNHEDKGVCPIFALGLMEQMPVVDIERHLPELMWWATNQPCVLNAEFALSTLALLPAETLRLANVEAELAASPLATSGVHGHRDSLAKLLLSIRSA